MSALIKYDAARAALAAAHSVDEVKDIHDKATAARAYAVQARDTELQRWASEIRIRAERALGLLLRGMAKAPGGQPYQSDALTGRETAAPTLKELGIPRDL